MAANPVIYWDTCVFISLLQDEEREDSGGIPGVVEEVKKGTIILITSVITRAEILQSKNDSAALSAFGQLFDRSNIKAINVDYPICEKASEIRDYYLGLSKEDGRPEVSFADALHIATAIINDASEFHTFDELDKTGRKKWGRGLITLNGDAGVDGLAIKKPSTEQMALDLQTRRGSRV